MVWDSLCGLGGLPAAAAVWVMGVPMRVYQFNLSLFPSISSLGLDSTGRSGYRQGPGNGAVQSLELHVAGEAAAHPGTQCQPFYYLSLVEFKNFLLSL